jgi:hypothetical protein
LYNAASFAGQHTDSGQEIFSRKFLQSEMSAQTTNTDQPQLAKSSLTLYALGYMRSRWLLATLLSVLLISPCYWHRRIEAGDLASHTYNAWLAHLIGQGQAPGLYIVPQLNNALLDLALLHLGNAVGFVAAEKIVAAVCVLVFFWGSFSFIAAATRRAPWFLVPAIAMIAYGYTFYMGFLNFYLSLGLGFFAAALFWRGTRSDWIVGAVLAVFTFVAHPMGFGCLLGTVVYVLLAEKLRGVYRCMLFASTFLAVYGVHKFISHRYRSNTWHDKTDFFTMNGADQLALFGPRYTKLAILVFIVGSLCFLLGVILGRKANPLWKTFRIPLELWTALVFAALVIPEFIFLPQYGKGSVFGFVVSRLTTVTAIFGLCVLGSIELRKWHLILLAAIACVFFGFEYQDTGALNRMEEQAERLVAPLPYGHRVMQTMWPGNDSRIWFIGHLVDRGCIGKCFAYSNYEAGTLQFRLRALPGNPIVADSSETSFDMEQGKYIVRPKDLPISQIYQCDEADLTKLCIRDLVAGEKNGRIGHLPPDF